MKVAIIGCGNMGSAIAHALSEKKNIDLFVYDKSQIAMNNLASNASIKTLNEISEATSFDIVLIAIKPQVLPSMYPILSSLKPKMFISIAAGVSLEKLKHELNTTAVVRFMPNIAARTKSAVTAVAFSSSLTEDDKRIAMEIASSFGSAFELEEKLFPAFIGISGSAIAYVFEFMHQLAMGGVREGIAYKTSLDIVRDTLNSAISLQKEAQVGAIELETMVCSAAGTTIEGIKALDDGAFGKTVIDAVSAAANKSRELEKNA